MDFIPIKKAMEQGGHVSVRGWCYRERKSNKFVFIVLRDHSNIIQCIVDKEHVDNTVWQEANRTAIECSLEISGEIKEDKRAPTGFEIVVDNLKIIGISDVFPISKDKSTEFLLDIRHLWLRSRMLTAVMKVKASVMHACRKFFDNHGYQEVTPPIITGSSCEGGSTLFKVDYFGEPAYLSQSAQLYLEAMIFSLEKVWSLTPSFRAEKSRTQRHLAEYWHLEAEAAWMDFELLMKFLEEMVEFVCHHVADECGDALKLLGRDADDLKKIKAPFSRLAYDEAVRLLQENGFEIKWGEDFGAPEEKFLTEKSIQPIFVVKYPKEIKAFYMKTDPGNPKLVLNCDMIAPEGFGEIIGASERETDYNELISRLNAQGDDVKNYEWYLDLRKYGSVPHSGFGLGIERIVRWICRLESIRDAVPFPRTMNRKYP